MFLQMFPYGFACLCDKDDDVLSDLLTRAV